MNNWASGASPPSRSVGSIFLMHPCALRYSTGTREYTKSALVEAVGDVEKVVGSSSGELGGRVPGQLETCGNEQFGGRVRSSQ